MLTFGKLQLQVQPHGLLKVKYMAQSRTDVPVCVQQCHVPRQRLVGLRGTSVSQCGRLLSSLTKADGYFVAEIPAEAKALLTTSLTDWYLAMPSSGQFLPRCIVCNAVLPIAKVSVCLSVCLSVCHGVNCDKTNESSAEILIPHER